MLKNDTHKRAMERLEQLIDPDWVAESDAVQQALWEGQPFTRVPCIVSTPTPPDWPTYPFTERWDDVEEHRVSAVAARPCRSRTRAKMPWRQKRNRTWRAAGERQREPGHHGRSPAVPLVRRVRYPSAPRSRGSSPIA